MPVEVRVEVIENEEPECDDMLHWHLVVTFGVCVGEVGTGGGQACLLGKAHEEGDHFLVGLEFYLASNKTWPRWENSEADYGIYPVVLGVRTLALSWWEPGTNGRVTLAGTGYKASLNIDCKKCLQGQITKLFNLVPVISFRSTKITCCSLRRRHLSS